MQQKAMGTVADSSLVTIPTDAAEHFSAAIKSARSALLVLEPWLETQPKPTQFVVRRLVSWWKRAITVTEPMIVQSSEE